MPTLPNPHLGLQPDRSLDLLLYPILTAFFRPGSAGPTLGVHLPFLFPLSTNCTLWQSLGAQDTPQTTQAKGSPVHLPCGGSRGLEELTYSVAGVAWICGTEVWVPVALQHWVLYCTPAGLVTC
jgi:hypothetical protein